jgi:predicted PurR-regulated permease PerM
MLFEKEFKKLTTIAVLAILLVLSFLLIKPIIMPLVIGGVLAYIFIPIYSKVNSKIKSKNLSATLVLLILLSFISFSLWILVPLIITQAFELYIMIQNVDFLDLARRILPQTLDQNIIREIVLNFNKLISSFASGFFSSLTDALFNLHKIFLKITVSLIVFFFFLRDNKKVKSFLCSMSPFPSSIEEKLSTNLQEVTNAVIYGTIIVGVIQGLLTGLGLFIFRVPGVTFLTLIAILASIIPIVGAWLVWIPASIYLFSIGEITLGIGLVIYGLIFISWIDNLLRPYFISKRTSLSTALIFIGMLGGLLTYGMIGLILGPLILSYLSVALESYLEHSKNNKKNLLKE